MSRSIDELIAAYRSGWSLEQAFYLDPAIYRREVDRIFMRNWIFAGHETQIPNAGDFVLLEVAEESAIVVRGRDDEIRALVNVCRHRGSRICVEQSGHAGRFTCPYHAWTYGLDGRLLAAREMDKDFSRADHGLHHARVEIVSGLIFVCFSDDPPSLAGAQRDLADPLRILGFKDLKVAAHKRYEIAANWKLAVENYQECYHCAPAHPEYARMHTLMLDDAGLANAQHEMLKRMPACGLRQMEHDYQDTHARDGEQGYAYSRTAMFEGFKTGSRTGEPLAPLLGELSNYDGGASDLTVGPVSFFLAYSDHVVGYVFLPVDQQRCVCHIYWMVRHDAREGADYDPDEITWLWHVTTLADERIIVNNQKGVNSRYYTPGKFSKMESLTRRFIDWVLLQIRDP